MRLFKRGAKKTARNICATCVSSLIHLQPPTFRPPTSDPLPPTPTSNFSNFRNFQLSTATVNFIPSLFGFFVSFAEAPLKGKTAMNVKMRAVFAARFLQFSTRDQQLMLGRMTAVMLVMQPHILCTDVWLAELGRRALFVSMFL